MPEVKIDNRAAQAGYEAMRELAKRGHYRELPADDASFVRMYMEQLRVAGEGAPVEPEACTCKFISTPGLDTIHVSPDCPIHAQRRGD